MSWKDKPQPTEAEIRAAQTVLQVWDGLRNRTYDERAIVTRMLVAAQEARERGQKT